MKRVKQFKLTNNDEIVCEVQSWPDEDTDEIIIKKALKIVSVEDYQRGIRFFALRPWMAFQDDPEFLHSPSLSLDSVKQNNLNTINIDNAYRTHNNTSLSNFEASYSDSN